MKTNEFVICLAVCFIVLGLLCVVHPMEEEVKESSPSNSEYTPINVTSEVDLHLTYECHKDCIYKERMKNNRKEINYSESICCDEFDYYFIGCGMSFRNIKEKDEINYIYPSRLIQTGRNETCEIYVGKGDYRHPEFTLSDEEVNK